MEEKQLLHTLSQMRNTQPRDEWVVSAKKNILGNEPIVSPLSGIQGVINIFKFAERPAFVIPVLAAVVFGGMMVQISTKSVPGDALYAVRSTIEQVSVTLSLEDSSLASVGVAERRLNDLRNIVEANKVKNLPATIEEFESSVAEVSRELTELVGTEPKKALQLSRRVVQLQESKAQVEQILGASIGGEQVDGLRNATKALIEYEIADLAERTLTEDQEALFATAREAFEKEDYQAALESIWMISNN